MGALSNFTATYDASGQLANQSLPNGTTATAAYDNTGTRRVLTYTLPASGGVSNTLTFTATPDAFNETVNAESPGSAQDNTYDNVGRLTKVADTSAGACTTRTYGFDSQGDRTSLTTNGSSTGGACQSTTGSTVTTPYDAANRIATSAGYSYDPLGRATAVAGAENANAAGSVLNANRRIGTLMGIAVMSVVLGTVSDWPDPLPVSQPLPASDGPDHPTWSPVNAFIHRTDAF
jgi:hypothetical protein